MAIKPTSKSNRPETVIDFTKCIGCKEVIEGAPIVMMFQHGNYHEACWEKDRDGATQEEGYFLLPEDIKDAIWASSMELQDGDFY